MMVRTYADAIHAEKEDILRLLSELADELGLGWGEDIANYVMRKIYDLDSEVNHAIQENLDELTDLQLKVEKLTKQKRFWKARYYRGKK